MLWYLGVNQNQDPQAHSALGGASLRALIRRSGWLLCWGPLGYRAQELCQGRSGRDTRICRRGYFERWIKFLHDSSNRSVALVLRDWNFVGPHSSCALAGCPEKERGSDRRKELSAAGDKPGTGSKPCLGTGRTPTSQRDSISGGIPRRASGTWRGDTRPGSQGRMCHGQGWGQGEQQREERLSEKDKKR